MAAFAGKVPLTLADQLPVPDRLNVESFAAATVVAHTSNVRMTRP